MPVEEIPTGDGWLYEPKWEGFRCLAFRDGKKVLLQSKAGQPLHRYFPELVQALAELPQSRFVLDGEIVSYVGKQLSFDKLLMRIHPAASRISQAFCRDTSFIFVLSLVGDDQEEALNERPLAERRRQLENFFKRTSGGGGVKLSPASFAEAWMHQHGKLGLDGIVAKCLDEPPPPR